MADITNYPEMTDELLQRYIAQAMQQAMKPADTGSPLSAGLLSAGLAMMAGSRGRSFGEALGQGGLLGLQAYGGAKEAQRKDPMQMINLLTAVEGLKEKQQGRQWMKNLTGATAAPAQFAMGSDFAPGDAPGPVTPPMQPQMVAPPMVRTAQGMQMGPQDMLPMIGTTGQAGKVSELLYKQMMEPPVKGGPGDVLFPNRNAFTGQIDQTQQIQIPNLDRNLEMTPKGVRPYTGVTQSIAEITQAQKDAEEVAKAKRDVITVTEGGRPRPVSREQWLTEQQQKPGVPPEMERAYQDYLRGDTTLPFKFQPLSKQNPTKPEEAGAVKAAEAPIAIQQSAQTGANTDFITNEFRPTMAQGQQAIKSIAGLDVLDNLPNTPTGWGMTAKVYGARVLEGMGFPSDKAKDLATNATIFNKTVQSEVNRKLMEAKGVQTEGDAQRAALLYSQLTDTNTANQFTRDIARAQHNQEVTKAKFYSSGYSDALKGGDPYVLEVKWREQQKSIFDDPVMKKWAIKEAPPKEKSGEVVSTGAPPAGAVVDGFQFKGGNPNDKKNWVKQ